MIGQGDPGGASSSLSELLWHQSRALFPIRVYSPADFDSERPYPAVIALHGFGGSSERFGRIGRAFAQAGFITAVPEGPYRVPSDEPGRHSTWELSTWTEEYGLGPPLTDDRAIEPLSGSLTVDDFFPSVIDRVREQYRVGPIYVFGFSLGGVYALVTGFHNRDQVDGIIAFGATYYRELFTARRDRVDGNVVEYGLVERNETIRAIGMTEVRHYPRLTFENGLVVRKEPARSNLLPSTPWQSSTGGWRLFASGFADTHPEAMSELLDADGAFVFSQKSGASCCVRLANGWPLADRAA